MQTIKRHISKQESAVWVVLFAFVVVLLYSFWGASVLTHQKELAGQSPVSVVAAR